MAISYISNAEDGYSGAAIGSRTVSINIGTRMDGLLVVGISMLNTVSSQTDDVSSVTYNGAALSKAVDHDYLVGASNYVTEIWYLTNPSNGTNDLVVTFAATTVTLLHIIVSWYDGAHQTQGSVLGNTNSGEGSTDPAVNITPPENNCLIVSQYCSEANNVLSVGSGETLLNDYDWGPAVSGGSYAIQSTAAAQTIDFNGTDSFWSMCVASFKQAASGVTAAPSAADAQAQALAPSVALGSLAVSPGAAGAAASAAAPGVSVGGVGVEPAWADSYVTAQAGGVILGSQTAAPAYAVSQAEADAPTVACGSITFMPLDASAHASASAGVLMPGTTIVPAASESTTACTAPAVTISGVVVEPAAASAGCEVSLEVRLLAAVVENLTLHARSTSLGLAPRPVGGEYVVSWDDGSEISFADGDLVLWGDTTAGINLKQRVFELTLPVLDRKAH